MAEKVVWGSLGSDPHQVCPGNTHTLARTPVVSYHPIARILDNRPCS